MDTNTDFTIEEKKQQAAGLMKDFIDKMMLFYQDIKQESVNRPISQETANRLASSAIPLHGRPVEDVYQEMLQDVYSNVALIQHPRSFSCIPSPVSVFSWMGDMMTSAYNPHASCQVNAPGANIIEKKLIRWMCDLAGYPKEAGGLFVSGGSIANLTALTAARDAKLSENERNRGIIYVSDQTHSSVAKGLHIIGFLAEQIKKIPSDKSFRMDLTLLQQEIQQDLAAGKKPFAIVASAGTTNTGSIDPLSEIAEICKTHNMWMHVDGAFGASVLLSNQYKDLLKGIEFSDSLSWDAHKWMRQTYACSVVLVRDQSCLTRSFLAHPEYLKDSESSEGSIEFWDLGPELTRPARSLKLWMTLQILGKEAMAKTIDHSFQMAELAEKYIKSHADWEIVSHARLGIVNFRFAPKGYAESALDEINQKIAKEITDNGYAQVFTTEIKGKKVLRICTLHPETTAEDIQNTILRLTHSHTVTSAMQLSGVNKNASKISA